MLSVTSMPVGRLLLVDSASYHIDVFLADHSSENTFLADEADVSIFYAEWTLFFTSHVMYT